MLSDEWDSISGKLGNSRLEVAIMADIRPLNHLALQLYSCPIPPVCPRLSTSPPPPPSPSVPLVFETLSDWKCPISQLVLCGVPAWLLINQVPFSLRNKTQTEKKTHHLHCLDQGLVLLILQRASAERLKAAEDFACPLVCETPSPPHLIWLLLLLWRIISCFCAHFIVYISPV